MADDWVDGLSERLPRHARLIRALRDAVASDERWRWFDVSCSLGAGRGDEFSDIDAGIGYAESVEASDLESLGAGLVAAGGEVVDVLAHVMDGWPADVRRFAVEYADGVQLDLVLMPGSRMNGLRDGEVAILDKDGVLAGSATSRLYGPPSPDLAREWVLTAWWWVSDIAKYLHRGSLFEAADRIALVREHSLRLFASAKDVPYPSFGLTSLLDYEPYELPVGLAETFPVPSDRASVVAAAAAVVSLLADSAHLAAEHLNYDLSTAWASTARARLEVALNEPAAVCGSTTSVPAVRHPTSAP